MTGRRDIPAVERIAANVVISPTTGCWEWQRAKSGAGYGQLRINTVLHYTHRLAYQLHVGPIPDGMDLDHLCGNPPCCNPAHLEPVTHTENVRRALRIGHGPNAPKTCGRGHDFAVEPPYISLKRGRQNCRACRRARRAEAKTAAA